jgi:hypothetical protein
MKRLTLIYFILILIFPSSPLLAASTTDSGTLIESGSIKENTKWTKDGSPYKIVQPTSLAEGVTLTIEKGVQVEFARDAGLSAAFGSLQVNGTETEKVLFQFSPNINSGSLYNEEIALGSNSSLNHVEIHGARLGLNINGQYNKVENTLITDTDFYGIYLTGQNNKVMNSQLNSNQNGITLFGGENVLIGNTIVSSIETGVTVQHNATKNIFINNIISNSGKYGLHSGAPYDSIINRFYHNTFTGNQLGIVTGTANIFQFNNFFDAFHVLSSTSWNMEVSHNYWGTDQQEEAIRRVSIPETYYKINLDPIRTERSEQTDKINPDIPVIHPVTDNNEFITGTATPGDKVTIIQKYSYWTSMKEAIVDERGQFKVTFNKVPSGEKVDAFTTNSFGISSPHVTTMVLDSTKPTPPILEVITNLSERVKGRGEAGAKVTVKNGAHLLAETIVKQDGTFELSIPIQTEGTILTVFQTDSSQLTSDPITVTVKDWIAPSAPSVHPLTTKSTMITGFTEAGAAVYLFTKQRVLLKQTIAGEDGSFSFDIEHQPLGTIFKVDVVDKNGNRSLESTINVQLSLPILDTFTDKMSILKGKTEPGAVIWVLVDGSYHGTVSADSAGQFEYILGKLKPGMIIKVQVYKNGFTAEAVTEVEDVTPPTAPSVGKVTVHSESIVGVSERLANVTVKINGVVIAEGLVNNAQEFNIKIPRQKAGTILEVQAVDGKGNRSAVTTLVVENVSPAKLWVPAPTNKSTQLIGHAEPNAIIIAKIASESYSTKAGSDGVFKFNIPVQNVGEFITITQQKMYSNISETLELKVIKAVSNRPQ